MSATSYFVFSLIAALLLALAVSLVVLLRQKRHLRIILRNMRDAAPREIQDALAHTRDASSDLDRLSALFHEVKTLVEAKTAALDRACALAGLGTWTILPDLKSFHASSHIRALLGFPEDDRIVQLGAVRQRIVPEDRAAFDGALNCAVTDRQKTVVEFRAFDADENIRMFRAETGPHGAVPGEAQEAISGVIQDITDLRHSEAELERSRWLETKAGEVARLGAWRYDITARDVTFTHEAAKLVEAENDQSLQIEDAIARFEDEDDRERIERGFWTCVGAGTRFDEIGRFRRLDGTDTWLRVIGEAERDQSGTIKGVSGAIQDVAELVSAKSATDQVRTLLEATIDTLSDGFVIHECDGTIRYMNQEAYRILGMPGPDLIGSDIRTILPEGIDPLFEKTINEALATGKSQSFEGEIVRPGHWINVAVLPTRAGVAIYLEDVTSGRETRARLRLLDAAVANLNDVVMITDVTSIDTSGPRVVFVNNAFETMTGYSKEEILGATPRILQGPDTEQERLEKIRSAIASRHSLRTELTNYRKDGGVYTVAIHINPLFDEAGTCTHYVSVQRDTTERREREQRLAAREEQFRLASMASNDIIWDWDMRTGELWNSENSAMEFWPMRHANVDAPRESRLENTLERIHPDDRLKFTESLDAALAGNMQTWRCEYRLTGPDGAWRHMTDKAFILRGDDGTPRRMVGAMSDVTDLKTLDAQLHQSQKLETVGQLTGGIAHDFNNLLTIILGNCDILMDDIDTDSALRPLLKSIEDAAENGARVSNDLLAFSRRQPLEPQPTDVNDLIRRSTGLYERAVDAGVDLRYELFEPSAVAHVDPDKLRAALINLVINAKAAIPQEGTITIRTRPAHIGDNDSPPGCSPGAYVEIDVVDDGVGMPPEVVERAFEPFFTTKESGVGTGMGLSSVYGMVKQSGGHAFIDSEPGRGTTVTLRLPEAQETETVMPAGPAAVASYRGRGQRILVVEDDAELRSFVSTMLDRWGYDVVEAVSGERALALLETDEAFDLLFTDIVMPGTHNGVQLARKSQEMYPGLRVLLTSGYGRDALQNEKHVPADIPILYKPFRTFELIEKLREALSDRNAPSELTPHVSPDGMIGPDG